MRGDVERGGPDPAAEVAAGHEFEEDVRLVGKPLDRVRVDDVGVRAKPDPEFPLGGESRRPVEVEEPLVPQGLDRDQVPPCVPLVVVCDVDDSHAAGVHGEDLEPIVDPVSHRPELRHRRRCPLFRGPSQGSSRSSREQRLHERISVKRLQVVDPFANPDDLTGRSISWRTATTIPPLAVPSSLVTIRPVHPTDLPNTSAWRIAFCPLLPSRTSKTSCGAPGIFRAITPRTFSSSRIRCVCVWSRPAVSTIRTSTLRARARSQASCATLAGSAPGAPRTRSDPERSAQIASWSAAAARKVSHAARRIVSPRS